MRSMRRMFSVGLVAVMVFVVAAPALAETVSVTDPRGDGTPDILKLTLANNESTLVLKQKYTEISEVSGESIQINWGDSDTYYEVVWVPGEATYFYFVNNGEGRSVECPRLSDSHSADRDLSVYRIPRSCIPRAGNRLTAKGQASLGSADSDRTRRTPAAARG